MHSNLFIFVSFYLFYLVSGLGIKGLQILFHSSQIGALVDEILMQDKNSKDYMNKYLDDFIEMSFSYSQNEYKESEYLVGYFLLINKLYIILSYVHY